MKVKYTIIPSNNTEMVVIVEDGGVATCHHNGSHILTEYYQDRITQDMLDNIDDVWNILAEGKMYCKNWEEKQEWDQEVVNDMLNWLYISTENVEFVRCEANFNDLDSIKSLIK